MAHTMTRVWIIRSHSTLDVEGMPDVEDVFASRAIALDYIALNYPKAKQYGTPEEPTWKVGEHDWLELEEWGVWNVAAKKVDR